jgi:hypothetical protein
MNTEFDDIRCYNDGEIHDALVRLCDEKKFMKVVSTVYPLLPKEQIKQRLLAFNNTASFQSEFIYPFLQGLEANLTKGIDFIHSDKFSTTKPYLYISNHRDIILDSAFLCAKLIERKIDTVEIAIGDNLLVFPWIEELVKVNKSFIVKRGLSPRQVLESSKKLSKYIAYTITDKQQSIWLAQREGRAKDSNDRTQESLLKMLNMGGEGTIGENLSKLNICPLSISYEYDPCDYLKAKEFQQKRDNPEHKKSPGDDLINMQTGVLGYKGKVTYAVLGDINAEITELSSTIDNKAALYSAIAALIDNKIHSNYEIYNVNKIAYDILHKSSKFENEYTIMEKLDFEKYIEKQIEKIDLANKDHNFLLKKILEMYSNPLINQLETK